jgi:hypothetical protein
MLLIYSPESYWQTISEQERGKIYQEYLDFTDSIRQSGHYVAGDPLERTAAATTVRVRNGKAMATDGPFAETREQLGGYYIVEAKNLDEATAIAERIPSSRIGSIEVRPIVDMPEGPARQAKAQAAS